MSVKLCNMHHGGASRSYSSPLARKHFRLSEGMLKDRTTCSGPSLGAIAVCWMMGTQQLRMLWLFKKRLTFPCPMQPQGYGSCAPQSIPQSKARETAIPVGHSGGDAHCKASPHMNHRQA